MSSRSEQEILLEQECDRLKSEIDRHVRIYELALKEQTKELERWRKGGVTEELLRKHDGCILVGEGCEIALAGTTKQAAADAARLEWIFALFEREGQIDGLDFTTLDRATVDTAMKGGANG